MWDLLCSSRVERERHKEDNSSCLGFDKKMYGKPHVFAKYRYETVVRHYGTATSTLTSRVTHHSFSENHRLRDVSHRTNGD